MSVRCWAGAMVVLAAATATEASSGTCDSSTAAARPLACSGIGKRKKVHKSKDGSSFVYDVESRSWRLATAGDGLAEDNVAHSSTAEVASAHLALEWSQFGAVFDGGFTIEGRPLLLDDGVSRRASGEQAHGDTGSSVWDGAVVMAKLFEANPGMVRAKRVLEFGAGRGVVGISTAALGASRVVMTDLDYCVDALRAVVDLNLGLLQHQHKIVEVSELDWFSPAAFVSGRPAAERFDVFVAADVVWLSELTEAFAEALAQLAVRSPGVKVLIAHQTRSTSVDDAFLSAMAERRFELAWTLPGGIPLVAGLETEISKQLPEGIDWHPKFRPDARIRLWCFRLPATPPRISDAV